jgi:hypothetical protein
MLLILGILWTIGLFVLLAWSGKHSLSVWRRGPSTYFPHLSHFFAWAHVALSMWAIVLYIIVEDNSTIAGAIICFAFGAWQMSRAIRLLIAFLRKKDIEFS